MKETKQVGITFFCWARFMKYVTIPKDYVIKSKTPDEIYEELYENFPDEFECSLENDNYELLEEVEDFTFEQMGHEYFDSIEVDGETISEYETKINPIQTLK